MIFRLHKISAPGWTKDFAAEDQARDELFKYICQTCRDGWEDEGWREDPVDEHSSLGDLLATACGCEFDMETCDE